MRRTSSVHHPACAHRRSHDSDHRWVVIAQRLPHPANLVMPPRHYPPLPKSSAPARWADNNRARDGRRLDPRLFRRESCMEGCKPRDRKMYMTTAHSGYPLLFNNAARSSPKSHGIWMGRAGNVAVSVQLPVIRGQRAVASNLLCCPPPELVLPSPHVRTCPAPNGGGLCRPPD